MTDIKTFKLCFASTIFVAFFAFLLAPARIAHAQELPTTAAAKRLMGLLECINNNDAEARKPFLENEFSDEGDLNATLEQRMEISNMMHQRFAPLVIAKIVESNELSVTAHCNTSQDVMLEVEVLVSATEPHKVTDISMGPVESEEEEAVPEGMMALFDEGGKSALKARGVWQAKGYGYVLEVTEDALNFYNVTKSFGWKGEFYDGLFFKLGDDSNTAVFTMHALEPGYNVVRLKQLPPQCKVEREWKPTEVFDAFVEVFRSHYPFFEVRNVDWEARVKEARPTVNDDMTEVALFEAMKKMLENLGDGHVYLRAEIDGKERLIRSNKVDTRKRLRSSFKPSEKFKTYQSYFRDWRKRFRASRTENTLRGKGIETCNNQIVWGRPHDRIGYIAIDGMGGYSYGNTDSQVETLHESLNEILAKLADTDALIVDVAFNGGGSDLFSLEIASHFTDKRRLGFSKWPATEKQYRQDRYVIPHTEENSDATMYLKPVYLVTNDVTASAAEIFTMCMRSIPQVKTVGLNTEGALSDILVKQLPNGWELGLSNEIYTDHEGECHEGPGVAPQVEMEIFNHADVDKIGHAESMQKIVKMMLKDIGGE